MEVLGVSEPSFVYKNDMITESVMASAVLNAEISHVS
jgi:hypothetical protein